MLQKKKLVAFLWILIFLNGCQTKGDEVWVFTQMNKNQELLKVNSITEIEDSKIEVKAIVDIYNEEKTFEQSIIFHLYRNKAGSSSKSIIHKDKPLTILTDSNIQKLSNTQKKQVKNNVLLNIKKMYEQIE